MAVLKGYEGQFTIDGTALAVTAWSYTGTINTEETTAVSAKDQTFEYTTRAASGDCTVPFDASNAQQKIAVDMMLTSGTPAKVLLQLYQDLTNDKQLYFSAVINSIGLPGVANGLSVLTINWTKDGATYHVPTT